MEQLSITALVTEIKELHHGPYTDDTFNLTNCYETDSSIHLVDTL